VLQCLSVAGALARRFPGVEIDWITREDLAPLVSSHPDVRRVFTIRKGDGAKQLWRLARELRTLKYDRIYDAHNNLRSHLICWMMYGPWLLGGRLRGLKFLRRSIRRFRRFLLFRFRWNFFRQPFSGQRDLLEPLKAWGVPESAPPAPQLFLPSGPSESLKRENLARPYIALAPSAAYALKRWPLDHWKDLIRLMPDQRFVVLGGKEDLFLAELEAVAPGRVRNMAGRLSLLESAAAVGESEMLIANDTGVLHMAEQLGKTAIALMGPAPFGFPSRPATKIMELSLACRPCSKHGQGPCVNPEFHKCLAGIAPLEVARQARVLLGPSWQETTHA
jgi:ADP-heptose:LPS heptosyltransferase